MPDVWELRGPAFMGVYAVLVLVSLVAAAFMRWQLSGPSSTPGPDPVLDPYETAYITGGPFAVVNAAVASLVARQALSLSSTGRVLTVSGMLPDDAYPAERVVYDKVIMTETATVPEIRAAAEPAGRDVGRSLESLGLVLSPSEQWSARWLPLAMGLLPLALGVPKIVIGIWRDRPVVFLFIACIITVALAGHFFGRRIFASRAGKALVERMRARHSALRTTGTTSDGIMSPPDVAMATALFGVTALAGGPYTALASSLTPPSNSGGSGCGTTSCGSSSCGGGGGGCGGCGGD